jgi:hypothetical protein
MDGSRINRDENNEKDNEKSIIGNCRHKPGGW